jgi:hypothetical protein
VRNVSLNGECQYLLFHTNKSGVVQNIVVSKGVKGNELNEPGGSILLLPIEIPVTDNEYELKIARNSYGDIKMYCEADLIL